MDLLAAGLLFLVLCSTATSLVTPSRAATTSSDLPPAVLDIDGQSLIPGVKYYVLPVFRGFGGGLTIGDRSDKCPLYVAQAPFELQKGLPMTFTPVNPDDDEFVRVSTDLNVHVADVSTVWKLGSADESTGDRYVSIDGDEGNPGPATVGNWFRIERHEDDYKLAFCPAVCETCRPACGHLVVSVEEHKRWLVMTSDDPSRPFLIMFKRADHWTAEGTL